MADERPAEEVTDSGALGAAIMKGVIIATPLSLIGFTLGIWAITSQDLLGSAVTALLPGVLFGGFAGGFAGLMLSTK